MESDWRPRDAKQNAHDDAQLEAAQRDAFRRRFVFGCALAVIAIAVVDLFVLESAFAPEITFPLGLLGVAYVGAALAVGTFGRVRDR